MPQNTHLESISAEAERLPEPVHAARNPQIIHEGAAELARTLTWLPNSPSSHTFAERSRVLAHDFKPIFTALELPAPEVPISDDFRWLYDNSRLLYAELQNTASIKSRAEITHVRTPNGETVPRVLALAEGFLELVSYEFSEQEFTLFLEVFQQTTVLQLRELWMVVSVLKLVLLEQIAARGKRLLSDPNDDSQGVGICVRSLRDIGQTTWKDALEPLMVIDRVLRQDPADAYGRMDYESRDFYRNRVSNIAEHSDFAEVEVAKAVVALAEEARHHTCEQPRTALREAHVGYYLIDEGRSLLHQKVRFRPPFGQKIQGLSRKHPDECFLMGIQLLTLAIMSMAVIFLTDSYHSLALILFSMLILFLPSSQSAVQLMNYLVTSLLPAEILPKLDFTEAIPDNCVTMVAVPSLLLSEQQVRELVENLEVRFLGNHDPNVHFALVTDLPDSREPAREDNPLITLCSDCIRELNEKYASQNMGSFFLFHRHRVYNPREKSWMGWERKRGKLLDLNKLLRGQYDSFPVKIGELSILPSVRFVITLDSDTELPRGTEHRMVGALAHPLNQAIIDPQENIVVDGYGILQPRVGVSVQSTARSRLAAIYAGETGFDIYTRAISDAYQDLYREGSFTGKGIYEVDAVHRVLDRRFPRNSLLSHDLLEGAYARAGLASDIEVIEDYPSHYSAFNRRKHRWLRGDWQIAEWLSSRVPDESGARVANPISLVSRWKIFDNLRRSLLEPATFLLLLFDWLAPGQNALRLALAAILILVIPPWFELAFGLVRAVAERKKTVALEAASAFYAANFSVLLTLIFLAHQTLLSLDAVVRALVRRNVTRERLLEWDTAAEAELGARSTLIDRYLDWMPFLAIGVGLLVWLLRPHSLMAAIPILVLWAGSKVVASWLNESPALPGDNLSQKDTFFLRRAALYTWRYFAEFCTEEHNWLIPDNVQEHPPAVAARVSPTNLGLLLNAQQVAVEFGYLTIPEMALSTQQTLATAARLEKHRGHLLNWYDTRTLAPLAPWFISSVDRGNLMALSTQQTLATAARLEKHRGHLLNWYDTRTLAPLAPWFISSVDSGNLLASLWTLQQGCLDCLGKPLVQQCLAQGLLDHLRVLTEARALPRKLLAQCEANFRDKNWLHSILELRET